MDWYDELIEIVNKIKPYYVVDKIKPYAVYIYTKCDNIEDEENVFDITAKEIIFYNKNHKIISKAIPIIKEIQKKLGEKNENR